MAGLSMSCLTVRDASKYVSGDGNSIFITLAENFFTLMAALTAHDNFVVVVDSSIFDVVDWIEQSARTFKSTVQ